MKNFFTIILLVLLTSIQYIEAAGGAGASADTTSGRRSTSRSRSPHREYATAAGGAGEVNSNT